MKPIPFRKWVSAERAGQKAAMAEVFEDFTQDSSSSPNGSGLCHSQNQVHSKEEPSHTCILNALQNQTHRSSANCILFPFPPSSCFRKWYALLPEHRNRVAYSDLKKKMPHTLIALGALDTPEGVWHSELAAQGEAANVIVWKVQHSRGSHPSSGS